MTEHSPSSSRTRSRSTASARSSRASRRAACASSPGAICSSRRKQAEAFYVVHKERPFYGELCTFMSSGPVFVSVLEGENAIAATAS